MSEPTATTGSSALLLRARCLLLDFDGPICAIFAGSPAPDVARWLVDGLRADGDFVPSHIEALTDPFDVLRFADTIGEAAGTRTDARLRAAELKAVQTATPTRHATDLIRRWRDSGRAVAVVSNNSEAAVTAYLANRGIDADVIVGRTSPRASLLKPDPHLVMRAVERLHTLPIESVLVGDSPSDIVAGRRAGVATIGYANKPGKRERLTSAGADHVVDDLQALALAISRHADENTGKTTTSSRP